MKDRWQNQRLDVFVQEQVDPATGIKTSWKKDIRSKNTTRSDVFPNGYPLRNIFTCEYFQTYSVYSSEQGKHGSLSITKDGSKDMEIGLDMEEGSFNAQYSEQGTLQSFNLFASNSNEAKEEETGDLEHFVRRKFDINLRELADLFRFYGATIFFPLVNILKDFDLESSKEKDFSSVLSDFKKRRWSSEDVETAMDKMALAVGIILEKELPNDLTEDEKTELIYCLSINALKSFIQTTNDPNKNNLYFDVIKASVATTLFFYYNQLENSGFSSVHFKKSDDVFRISIEGLEKVFYEDALPFGEKRRYAEEEYGLKKTNSGTIRLIRRNTFTQSILDIEFPTSVDIHNFEQLITTENNKGWERSLPLIPISSRSTAKENLFYTTDNFEEH